MKLGCVVAYSDTHNNYGTYLQDFAMITALQKMGFECEIIRYKKHLTWLQKIKLVFFMYRCHGTMDKYREVKEKINLKIHKKYAHNISVRTKSVFIYKLHYLKPLFKVYDGYDMLCKNSLNYDAVIVGSDQMWTPLSLYSNFYNLIFVDDSVRKVSYATSFGVSKIPKFQHKATAFFLDRFYRISVREASGKKIVDSLSKNKAKVVLDPTMLLTPEEWQHEISISNVNIDDKYIFCYFLGKNPEARAAANKLKHKTGLKIIAIRHMDEYIKYDEKFGDYAPYDVNPNDFVNFISHAEYVCTDSFHCSVFSILFKRKFMTFYRFNSNYKSSRNTRIDNLLSLFNIQERLYQGNIDLIFNEINYSKVHNQLDVLRKDSFGFLSEALNFN